MAQTQGGSRDQLDQDLDCLRECTYVEEADEISRLIQQTVESEGMGAQTAYLRFRKIVRQFVSLTTCSCATYMSAVTAFA